jgi:ABC-type sugar transport system ATPase subunit
VVERVRRNTTTRVRSQRDAARLGIAYVPRDRRTEGIFEPLSILDNFGMPTLGDDRVAGVLGARRRSRRFEAYRTRLSVRMGRAGDRITSLSGGNQQKVILARWLAARPDVFVLNDPTRGVDQGTKTDIYQLLDEATSEGMAVVLLSSEVEELVSLVDRALVFHEQRVFIELAGQDITREAVVAAFFGRTAPEERGDD